MDVALAIFNVGAGLGILAAGIGLAWLAIQAVPLLRETRALTADIRRVTVLVDHELRPILAHAREVTGNVEVLSEDVAVKLDRLTDLMNSLQGSLDTVQITASPREPQSAPSRYTDPPFWETDPRPDARREAESPVESWHPREE